MPVVFHNFQFRLKYNFMFAALEASWLRLCLGMVIGFIIIGILLAGLLAGGGCGDPGANFGRMILLVVGQVRPSRLEQLGLNSRARRQFALAVLAWHLTKCAERVFVVK